MLLDGSLPSAPKGQRRTRRELRDSCLHVLDTVARTRLENALRDQTTPLKDVIAISDLYARLGSGFVGANEIDPADVAALPAPVFQTLDPDAPLPDGKPDLVE